LFGSPTLFGFLRVSNSLSVRFSFILENSVSPLSFHQCLFLSYSQAVEYNQEPKKPTNDFTKFFELAEQLASSTEKLPNSVLAAGGPVTLVI